MAERRSIGVFRLFGSGSGWLWTLLLVVPVVAVIGYGLYVSDPGRNPAPAAYREAACETHAELGGAVEALQIAVEVARSDGREAAVSGAREAQDLAVEAIAPIAGAPDWPPGDALNGLLRSAFSSVDYAAVTLIEGEPPTGLTLPLPGFAARPADPVGTAEDALAVARDQQGEAKAAFAEQRYGFSCAG